MKEHLTRISRKRFHGLFSKKNEVKSGDQAVFEMKSLDWACGRRVETSCAKQNLSHEITWIRNAVKSGDQAVFEMKSLDWACGKWSENSS